MTEWKCRSGKNYVVTLVEEFIPPLDAPLGWRSFCTFVITELSHERQVVKAWNLSSGGAVFDYKAISNLAKYTDFCMVSISTHAPSLYEERQKFRLQKEQ